MTPEEARELFPITRHQIYLQHAGVSPLSLRAAQAVERVARRVSETMDWDEDYFRELAALRSAIAGLIGVEPESIAFTRGTGHGLSLLSAGLDWREGDNIVSVRQEYPTNVFPWTSLRRKGVELRLVDPVDGRTDPDTLLGLIDERTRVVAVSWVQFWNGFRTDVERIGAGCRQRNVRFVIDAIQGLGALRLNIPATGADLVAAGAQKWLMGPPGIGICYIGCDLMDELSPPLIGGRSIIISPGVPFEDLLTFHPGARRFEESMISWLDVAAFAAGLDLLAEVTPGVVEDRVLGLACHLGEGLSGLGLRVTEPWPRASEESSGIVSFRPAGTPEDVVKTLHENGIVARAHDDLVRFSPHFYNTFEEMELALTVLATKVAR